MWNSHQKLASCFLSLGKLLDLNFTWTLHSLHREIMSSHVGAKLVYFCIWTFQKVGSANFTLNISSHVFLQNWLANNVFMDDQLFYLCTSVWHKFFLYELCIGFGIYGVPALHRIYWSWYLCHRWVNASHSYTLSMHHLWWQDVTTWIWLNGCIYWNLTNTVTSYISLWGTKMKEEKGSFQYHSFASYQCLSFYEWPINMNPF